MYKSKINIGDNSFLVQFRKYKEDNVYIKKKYVFIRKYYIMNNIIYDTEIFVIEKDIAKKVIKDINSNNEELTESIVFPYLDNKKSYYSNNYKNFNSSFNKGRFNINENNDYAVSDLYNIVDKNNKSIFIPCNEIRIYHPIEISKLKSVIHVDAYYNDIHFHFYCNKYDNLEKFIDNEIKIDNNIYSEYIKFYIPDIEYLFFDYEEKIKYLFNDIDIESHKTYFCDDLSISEIENNEENQSIKNNIIKIGDKTLLPFSLFLKPFKIEKINIPGLNVTLYKKIYVNVFKTIENNYITSPVNLTIYPYKEIDKENNLYILSEKYNSSSITFSKGYHFTLSSKLGFDIENGYCSVINKFNYENDDRYTIQQAYSLYNNVTEQDYINAKIKLYRKYLRRAKYKPSAKVSNVDVDKYYLKPKEKSELLEKESFLEIGYPNNFDTYEEYYKDENGNYKKITNDEDREKYKNEIYILDLTREEDDDLYNKDNIKLMGYKFEISNDLDFKNIIYSMYVEQDFIDNFTFNINNIFDSWSNMPDILVARSIFFDKYLGKIICSNRITITKEWFKYLINNDFYNSDKIPFIKVDLNKAYLVPSENNTYLSNKIVIDNEGDSTYLVTKNNLFEKDFMDVVNGFNFIDKINCTIKKENKDNNITGGTLGGQKILYKPIFFRVKDLQNIKLKSGVVQKIGVNLSDYMTKVEGFKLSIDNNTFKEVSRNDIYTIFSINANLIENETGRYIITNEEDEYISDGVYTLY